MPEVTETQEKSADEVRLPNSRKIYVETNGDSEIGRASCRERVFVGV